MTQLLTEEDLYFIAPAGYYIALRIGFAFPALEINKLSKPWIEFYTVNCFILHDPVMKWAYSNFGAITWDKLSENDPASVIELAGTYGMKHGVVVSVSDAAKESQRSIAFFTRDDRAFDDLEVKLLELYTSRRHEELAPPTNLTPVELSTLAMIKSGKQIKEIAFDMNVTEGAIKIRLKNAKIKLGAKNSTEATVKATHFGLI